MKSKQNYRLRHCVISFLCIVGVLTGVLWSDYKTAYAVGGGNILPWTNLVPNFNDFLMIMIANMVGIPVEVDRDTVRRLKGELDYDQRYNECKKIVEEKWGQAANIKLAFGWSDTEYDTLAEQTAHYYATTCQIMPEQMVPIYETDVYRKVWGKISDTLSNSGTLKKVFPDGRPEGLSFANFCFQAQQCMTADIAQRIVSAAGASVNNMCYVATGVNSQGVANILDNSLFKLLYTIYRVNVFEGYNDTLMGNGGQTSEDAVCDYSVDYWKAHRNILTINGTNFKYGYTLFFGLDFPTDVSKMFPLTFEIDNVPQIGVAMTQELKNLPYGMGFTYANSSSGSKSTNYTNIARGGYAPIISPSLMNHVVSFGNISLDDSALKEYYDTYNRRRLLYSNTDAHVWDENVIDVENLENFLTFNERVLGGQYTLEELLELMRNGWVANPGKDKAAVVEGGHVAKDVIDRSKDKYKDDDKVVTPRSLDRAMPKNPAKDDVWGNDVATSDETWEQALERAGEKAKEGEEESRKAIANGELAGFDSKTGELDRAQLGEDISKLPNPDSKKPYVPGLDLPDSSAGGDKKGQWYQRFPFCIPWDVYHFISVFNGQKKAPKWDIPFKIKRLNISEKITFDFADYEEVVKVIRVFLLLFYSSGLVIITRNIIKG